MIGVGRLAAFSTRTAGCPARTALLPQDAVGTSAGALLGTSTVTTYIESATGVEEGGRTGFTSIVAGIMFLLALFFIPLVTAVPALATAPALIIVGTLMMPALESSPGIRWTRRSRPSSP